MNLIGLLLPVLAVFIYQPGEGAAPAPLAWVLPGYLVANLLLLAVDRWFVLRFLDRYSDALDEAQQHRAAKAAGRWATLLFLGVNGLFCATVFALDLPLLIVTDLGIPPRFVVGDLLCAALPYAVLLASRRIGYPMWIRVRRAEITPGLYMELGVRRLLVFVLPQLLYFSVFRAVMLNVPGARELAEQKPALFLGVIVGAIFAFFLLSPALVRHLFPRHELGQGASDDPAHLDAIETLIQRAGLRPGRFFVWDTVGLPFANAVVTGMFSRYRHVYFSDYLLHQLDPDELQAVLAHEMGHVYFRHLLYNYLLSVALVLVLVWSLWAAEPLIAVASPALVSLLVLATIGAYMVLVMRMFMNRFEHQADLYAASLLGDPGLMQRTLQRIADLNLAPRGRRSLTHPSIDQRCAVLASGGLEPLDARLRRERRRNQAWLVVFALLLVATILLLELAGG